jgi:hypothetical protein
MYSSLAGCEALAALSSVLMLTMCKPVCRSMSFKVAQVSLCLRPHRSESESRMKENRNVNANRQPYILLLRYRSLNQSINQSIDRSIAMYDVLFEYIATVQVLWLNLISFRFNSFSERLMRIRREIARSKPGASDKEEGD